MVGNGDPYITCARGPHEIAFDAGFFYNHLLRDGRFSIALFDGVTWPNGNFAPRTKRLHPYSFGLFNFSLTAADIAQSRVANQLTGRPLANTCVSCRRSKMVTGTMHSRQQKFEVISRKLSAARGVKIAQASGGRWRAIATFKRFVSRAKVSR